MTDSQLGGLVAPGAALARGAKAARQALQVAELEFELARDSRLRGEEALAEVRSAMEAVRRSIECQMRVDESAWLEVERGLVALATANSGDATNGAVIQIAEAAGLAEWLPFQQDDTFDEFIADEDSVLVLGDVSIEQAPDVPSAGLTGAIGSPCEPPLAGSRREAVRHMVADRSVLAVAPYAGMHVSVKRAGYRHHGILIGDGTVAHYQMDSDPDGGHATVRTSFDDFLKDSDPTSLRRHFPDRRMDRDPAPVFMPNLTALRALRGLGNGGYRLLRSNCEHFGTWAQCGAMMSGQADGAWRQRQILAARNLGENAAVGGAVGGPLMAIAMETYLACWTMTVGDATVDGSPPNREPDNSIDLFDIGRIRWATDRGELLWWLPLWCSDDPERKSKMPFGPRDRSWCVGTPTPESLWYSTAPSISLAKDWHASLLLDPNWNLWVVDSDGRWWSADFDLDEVTQKRVEGIQRLNQALAGREDVFDFNEGSSTQASASGLPSPLSETLESETSDAAALESGVLVD